MPSYRVARSRRAFVKRAAVARGRPGAAGRRPRRRPAGGERGAGRRRAEGVAGNRPAGTDLAARSQAALVMAMVAADIKLPEDLRRLRPAKRYEPLVPDGPSS